MMRTMRHRVSTGSRWVAALLGVATLIALLALAPQLVTRAADGQNAAGLVIQYADGRIAYLYVEFTEPEISGVELLERSGLVYALAPYGGLGVAVCSIEGEGCPADNCFCKSYGQDAFFWRYHRLSDTGEWIPLPVGPASRMLKSGDVDGWSWSARDHGLPETSLAEIAKLNNVPDDTHPAPTDQATAKPETNGASNDPGESRGVIVDPNTGIEPLSPASGNDDQSDLNYVALAAGVGIVVVVGGWVVWQRRRATPDA